MSTLLRLTAILAGIGLIVLLFVANKYLIAKYWVPNIVEIERNHEESEEPEAEWSENDSGEEWDGPDDVEWADPEDQTADWDDPDRVKAEWNRKKRTERGSGTPDSAETEWNDPPGVDLESDEEH